MQIINPFFDATFKFLFQDPECARLILEVVTGFKIKQLQTLGQEYYRPNPMISSETSSSTGKLNSPVKEEASSSKLMEASRLDFVCRIVDRDQRERVCLVEVQRKAIRQQINRFRRYLGYHYSSEYNHKDNEALEILTVFFIGPELPEFRGRPLVKIDRKYLDGSTGQEFQVENSEFVEKLTHLVYLVSVHALAKHHRTLPEQVLQIFNQKQMSKTTNAVLEIDEKQFPKPFTRLLERLQYDKNKIDPLLPLILAEAEYEQSLERQMQEAIAARKQAQAEAERAKKDRKLAEREAQRAEQESKRAEQESKRAKQESKRAEQESKRAEQESKRAEQESKRAEQESKRAEQESKRAKQEAKRAEQEAREKRRTQKMLIEVLLKNGNSLVEVAVQIGISVEEATQLLSDEK